MANLVPKFQSSLFEIILGSKGYSRVLIPNLTTVFVHSVPKMLFFFGKFGQETSKCFVLKEARYKVVFKGADVKIAFVNSFPKIPFGVNLAPKPESALFKIKCSAIQEA